MGTLVQDISELESCLDGHRMSDAATVLLRTLQSIESGRAKFGETAGPVNEASRLAACIARVISAPTKDLPARAPRILLTFKRAISHVFEVSKFRGNSGLVRRFGAAASSGDKAALKRLLMVISINTAPTWLVKRLDDLEPKFRLLAILAFLAEYLNWSESAEQVRTALLDYRKLPDRAALWRGEWDMLASAWMACSYADSPRRHDIKVPLNNIVRNWLLGHGVRDRPPRRAVVSQGQRPTLLIINEIWQGGHAMDRCYRASVRSLRRRFHTVFMCVSRQTGQFDESLFDEVDREVFSTAQPEKFVHRASEHRPDVIYFPSVGMRIGGIACANLRLAPVQIATNGHPATTRSRCVDYMILPQDAVADADRFSEIVLLRPPGPYYVGPVLKGGKIEPDIRHDPSPVLLAVPAWIRKVTPRFIATCRIISQRAGRPLRFRFFPILRGAAYQAARRRLTRELPAEVMPFLPYEQYIAKLNECDVHLSTFPFGSTNGIVDSALQGLPVVNMIGEEPHSRLDAMLARSLDQPAWLTTSTIEEYINSVVRLVNDDKLRVNISEAILAGDPASRLLLDDQAETGYFADMVYAAYRYHDQIKDGARRIWRCDELLSLDQPRTGAFQADAES